jgi:hypothetical protein
LELQTTHATPANIQIELQRGATLVRAQWPLGCAGDCDLAPEKRKGIRWTALWQNLILTVLSTKAMFSWLN